MKKKNRRKFNRLVRQSSWSSEGVLDDEGTKAIIYKSLADTHATSDEAFATATVSLQKMTDTVFRDLDQFVMNDPGLVHPLDYLAKRVHIANSKWWLDINTGKKLEHRNVGELLMLMVSELAEAGEDSPQYFVILMQMVSHLARAMEGHRKAKMDDKLPQYPMFAVELVDAMVRLLDVAGSSLLGFPIGKIFEAKMAFNQVRKDHTLEHRLGADGKKY